MLVVGDMETVSDLVSNLSEIRRSFCYEFVQDLNGAKAAERSGYSPKTSKSMANKLKKIPEVKKLIEKLLKDRSDRLELTSDWVLIRLKEVVDRSMILDAVFSNGRYRGYFQADHSSAVKALGLIGKHLGMFKDDLLAPTNMPPINITMIKEIPEKNANS